MKQQLIEKESLQEENTSLKTKLEEIDKQLLEEMTKHKEQVSKHDTLMNEHSDQKDQINLLSNQLTK